MCLLGPCASEHIAEADLGGPSSRSAGELQRLLATAAGSGCTEQCVAPVRRPKILEGSSPRRASEESASIVSNAMTASTRCSFEPTAEAVLHSSEEALEPIPDVPGALHVAGFFLRPDQLPPGLEDRDLDQLVEDVHRSCSRIATLSKQQALRLVLGMGYSPNAAVVKWQEVVEWRKANSMDKIRQEQADKMRDRSAIAFPHQSDVSEKLVCVSPCALLAANGTPVSIWHAGTLNVNEAASLPSEHDAQLQEGTLVSTGAWH